MTNPHITEPRIPDKPYPGNSRAGKPHPGNPQPDNPHAGNHTILNADSLVKSYKEGEKERMVLDHLSLSVAQDDMVVLLGRSGSGKSTLLNLLSGIDRPDKGSVTISGHNITRLDEKQRTLFRRAHIGFVFQSFNLIPTLTVLENIMLPMELNGFGDRRKHDAARNYLDEVGLLDRSDTYPDRLSGGEQQRVAIARAVAHEPRLILADEPTGNLDYKTGSHVTGIFHQLAKKTGSTVIIATHDQNMRRFADHIYLFNEGTIHSAGDMSEQADA